MAFRSLYCILRRVTVFTSRSARTAGTKIAFAGQATANEGSFVLPRWRKCGR